MVRPPLTTYEILRRLGIPQTPHHESLLLGALAGLRVVVVISSPHPLVPLDALLRALQQRAASSRRPDRPPRFLTHSVSEALALLRDPPEEPKNPYSS